MHSQEVGIVVHGTHFLKASNELYSALFTNISALEKKTKKEKKFLAVNLRSTFQSLIALNQTVSKQLSAKSDQLKEELKTSVEEHTHTSQNLKKTKEEKKILTAELSGLNEKSQKVNDTIKELKKTITRHQSDIVEADQRRLNAALDLIPLYGLIDGIIKGDPRRGIPFFSQVNGIISLCKKEKEESERRLGMAKKETKNLNDESQALASRIDKSEQKMSATAKKLEELNATILSKDLEIKQIGKDLTLIGNLNISLKNITVRHRFLQGDLDLRVEMIDDGELDDNFISDIFNAAQSIHRTFIQESRESLVFTKVEWLTEGKRPRLTQES